MDTMQAAAAAAGAEMLFDVKGLDDELPPIGPAETPAEPVKPEPVDDPIEALRKMVEKQAEEVIDDLALTAYMKSILHIQRDDSPDGSFKKWMDDARAGAKYSRDLQAALYDYYRTRTTELYLAGEIGRGDSYRSYVESIIDYIPVADQAAYFESPWARRAADAEDFLHGLIEWLGHRYSQDPVIREAAEGRLKAKEKDVVIGIDRKEFFTSMKNAIKAEKEKVKEVTFWQ